MLAQALVLASRGGAAAGELAMRRKLRPLIALEHAALVALLASGFVLMQRHGWSPGHPRWLGIKLLLVGFLVVPLEGMHAYVSHVWIARGLRQTAAPPFSKRLVRGLGMEDMVRTLEALLFALAVPLLIWLSTAQPF